MSARICRYTRDARRADLRTAAVSGDSAALDTLGLTTTRPNPKTRDHLSRSFSLYLFRSIV